MNTKIRFIFFSILCLLLSGCSIKSIPVSSINTTIELDSSMYEIVGRVSGEATQSWLFLIIPIYTSRDPFKYGSLNGVLYKHVESMAIFDAIESNDIDALIAPKFEKEQTGPLPFYRKIHVNVTGIGIKFEDKI